MAATYATYSGTAQQYIREYLDPDGTLNDSPTTEEEARLIWADMERTFRDDGAGIDEETFVDAVAEMQEKFATVCGTPIQIDRSGVGHCWKSVPDGTLPSEIALEIECEIIDGGRDSCLDYLASNGQHYRW